MKYSEISIDAFFLLVRAGLFGCTEGVERLQLDDVDWDVVSKLAETQFVEGVVAGGIEHLRNDSSAINFSQSVPHKWRLRMISKALHLEKRNQEMNKFIAQLTGKLRQRNIHCILVKGQGVAQCYEKPLWRTYGDVDLLLNEDDYQKAKDFLMPYASAAQAENSYKKHLALSIGRWTIELHGSLRCGFSSRIDRELDKIQNDTFYTENVSLWMDGDVPVTLLGQENNVLFVFVHLLNHFYKEIIGMKQICDWCRMLWSYRDSLDLVILEKQLNKMGLMSEWRAFGAFAVNYLGATEGAIPFYSGDAKWNRKARQIQQFILKSGNLRRKGQKSPAEVSFLKRKQKSVWQRFGNMANHITIFPLDTLRFLPSIFINGLRQK